MFFPTHRYIDGRAVRLEDSLFLLPNGTPLRGPGIKNANFIPIAEESRGLTPEQLGLVLTATMPNPGAGKMPGYATSARGDCATLVAPGQVKLSIVSKSGTHHYLITIPETFDVNVTVLEEPQDADQGN